MITPSEEIDSKPLEDSDAKPLYVVGVGASAGGLEALQRLFERMPRTGGFAFVVVQHLSPDFRSLMDELLSPHTTLAVVRAEDGMPLERDTVYLMPARNEMIVSGNRLYLTERDPSKGLSLPIDAFFRSLGEDAGSRAIAVVMSGTGSDGSRGIRTVHEAGGLVIVQDEESAKFDGMPRSAIDTGIVDLVVPPEEIADALVRYLEHDGRLGDLAAPDEGGRDVMQRIFELLRRECGIEFADYKGSTVGRRIERRLLMSDSPDLEHYVARIAEDAGELRALYRDLLIGVTRFFRDPEAFHRLETEVIPALVDRTPAGEELRVWVAACATGEEAYSVALLIIEAFRTKGRTPLFRVFATDVHRPSLDAASAGIYPLETAVNVPAELRERYFERHADGFQVSSELRAHIVFAHHNVLRDAPFTRLDLLTCRNFLIYLKPPAQRRVLALFHFALKTGGVMLMGPSETPGPLAEEFAPIDNRWKIFRKHRDVRIAPDMKLTSPGAPDPGARPILARQPSEDPRVTRARTDLLERYAPPALLVDEAGRVLHTFNGGGEYLSQRDGKPSLNLLDLIEGELRFVLAGALKRAQKDHEPIVYGGVMATVNGQKRRVRVVVQSKGGSERAAECFAVVFEPDPAETPAPAPDPLAPVGDLIKERLTMVEGELRVTKENLQATIEEMETSNEELQATNEELIASNEELQSTNEELHSVNEELYTVNAEYQAKISELTELTADMNHLLEATEVHTIFLDRELRVRKFTPRIAQTFNLLPQDIGRRLDAFAHNLNDVPLLADLQRVVATDETVEREVQDRQGHSYFLRVLPYRTGEGTEGVVVTLVDLSALQRARRELAVSEERYRTLIRAITSILWTADRDGSFAVPQPEWEAYTGHGWEVHRGDGWLEAVHPEDRDKVRTAWRAALSERRIFEAEGRLLSKAHGDYRYFVGRAAPLLDPEGAVREWVGHVVDVHATKMAELALRQKEAQIRSILDNSPAFVWLKDPTGRYLVAGRQCQMVMGVPCDQIVGKTDYDFLPVAIADALRVGERRCLETGETIETEEIIPVGGQSRAFLTVKFPMRDEQDSVYAVGGISTDITERKRDAEEIRKAVERRDQFLAMLSHELRTPLGAILNAADLLERGGNGARHPGFAREVIRRQTRHMAKLIEDLLDVGRITRDQLVLDPQVIDLRGLIDDSVEALRPEAERKGLQLGVAGEGAMVRGDPARLRQILTNLIANAIAYTPAGRIDVTVALAGGQVQVIVRDTGIGLTADELERVFDLFYQTPQALDRKRGGLGVGLTLALKLARLHGGDIAAESAGRGTGSTFSVALPLAADAVREAQGALEVPRPEGKLRIVLVEDNEDIRDTLEDLLRLEGHDVVAESEGIRGAETIVERCPDVAIVDLGLPGMDGYEVAKAVRSARGGSVRLIALTGYGRREDRMETAGAGFDRHLVKPVDHDMLMRVLAEIAAGRRADA